jgi:Leucine-rich repeat (LRR) protein
MEHRNPCLWYGVYCSGGHVTKIELRDNNLSGSLPPQIGYLPYLIWFDLINNQVSGALPEETVHLTRLERLWLDDNDITGTFPVGTGGLCALTSIQMGNNQLGGTIPSEITCLPNLRILHLEENAIGGEIPPGTGSMPSLQVIVLSSNNLSGEIPKELGDLTLQQLCLDDNNFTGSIPAELGNLTSLVQLRLETNQLTGRVPEELGNIGGLRWLHLDHNQLHGSIPISLTGLLELVRFDYYETNLCTPADPALQNWLSSVNLVVDTGVTCNTPIGTSIFVRPDDENNQGTSQVEVTYNKVTEEGHTYLAISETLPDPPTDFRIGEIPLRYYEISSTATFDLAEICIQDNNLYTIPNDRLIIERYNPSTDNWDALQTEVFKPDTNPGNMRVCTEVDQLNTPASYP